MSQESSTSSDASDDIVLVKFNSLKLDDDTVVCPSDVIPGNKIDSNVRKHKFGVMGGANSMLHETYARAKIEEGTHRKCLKTSIRINLQTHLFSDKPKINNLPDWFDYSEDFDGVQTFDNIKIYVNLKCVVGKGGAQTRTLREVYWFIKGQFSYLQ
jgi:hypothetical protein